MAVKPIDVTTMANWKRWFFIAMSDCILFPEKTAYESNHIISDNQSYKCDLKDFSFSFT
jgi:hypothetical protein